MLERRAVHRTGFTGPFHKLQILSWILTFLHIVVGLVWVLPLLPSEFQIAFGVVFGISQGVVWIFAFWVTASDPTDKVIGELTNQSFQQQVQQGKQYTAVCNICDSFVSTTSKHWGQCNRWVENFDHHWLWYNNWIGSHNYRQFAISISALEVNVVWLIVAAIHTVNGLVSQNKEVLQRIEENFGSQDSYDITFMGIIIIAIISSVLVFIGNTLLLSLHIYLKCKNITTFQLIMKLRQRKRRRKGKVNSEPNMDSEIPPDIRSNLELIETFKIKTPADLDTYRGNENSLSREEELPGPPEQS